MTKAHETCSRCIMDTSVADIRFDADGVCNYCTDYVARMAAQPDPAERERRLHELVARIKNAGRSAEYDCVLGISGGLDSSYALYMAKKLGLRPLAAHLDNGWNSELAVSNIHQLVTKLDVDLFTHVIDWEEFRDIQIAFFRAHVVDIELVTDNAIWSALYNLASEKGIRTIIGGTNLANEGMRMPEGWNYRHKRDLKNIVAIHKRFGRGRDLDSFPRMGAVRYLKYVIFDRIRWLHLLNYLPFKKVEATRLLEEEVGWRAYEKKHYESVFTRFYQGYILPKKCNVDKRRLHSSTLIISGQMSRAEALDLMEHETYENQELLDTDREYVLKKLGFTEEEFDAYIVTPCIPHTQYPSNSGWFGMLRTLMLLKTRFSRPRPPPVSDRPHQAIRE